MTETLAVRAQRYIEKGPEAITSSLSTDVLAYLARKYVAREWQARQRAHARLGESEARRAIQRTPDEVKADLYRAARREAWKIVLEQGFVAGGNFVTWAAATRDEHRDRVGAQTDLVAGIEADIQLHLDAIADLETYGIERLADL